MSKPLTYCNVIDPACRRCGEAESTHKFIQKKGYFCKDGQAFVSNGRCVHCSGDAWSHNPHNKNRPLSMKSPVSFIKKTWGAVLLILCSAILGAALYNTTPKIIAYAHSHLNGTLAWLILVVVGGLILLSILIPMVLAMIAEKFGLLGNKVIAGTSALLVGGPVSICLIRNFVAGAYPGVFEPLGYMFFGGLLIIIITFIMIGFGNK